MRLASDIRHLLSRRQAQAYLRIGATTLWQLERSGRLRALRIGRRVLFRIKDIEAFLDHCQGAGGK